MGGYGSRGRSRAGTIERQEGGASDTVSPHIPHHLYCQCVSLCLHPPHRALQPPCLRLKRHEQTERYRVVQWRERAMSRMNVSQPSRSLASLHPDPFVVHLEEGTFLLFFTSCQAVVWASDPLPVVLFLSFPWRGTPLLFLVYRI